MPVNALAVGYGLFMAVNLAWPRQAVYDPAGGHWYLRYFAVLFCAAVAVFGYAAYLAARRSTATARATTLADVAEIAEAAA